MIYQGSKRRIAKEILPIILSDLKKGQAYVEPFLGGGNSMCNVSGEITRVGADINPYLIELWKGLIEGKRGPLPISRELYNDAQNQFKAGVLNFKIAWIGFVASFNGRFFDGGYARIVSKRNRHMEYIRNLEKQIPNMKGVKLYCCDYRGLEIPPNSIIYCDPPYRGTKGYTYSTTFSYEDFYEWLRQKKKEGHTVFVSEFEMPEDFICVWEKLSRVNIKLTEKSLCKERLFTL